MNEAGVSFLLESAETFEQVEIPAKKGERGLISAGPFFQPTIRKLKEMADMQK